MGSYNNVFGGGVIYPSSETYLALTFSADQTLSWPIEQQIGGNIVADIVDLDATAAGLNVDIPDARQVSTGYTALFNNVGANTVTVRNAIGGTIISLVSGSAWIAYLTDNSTEAGVWRIFQMGATVSTANAAALAGAGIKAISTTLNQTMPPTSTAVTPINLTDAGRAQLTNWTGGVGVLNFPAPGTVGSDWFTAIRNSGSGDLTLTPPSGTIDGSSTLALSPGESTLVVTDGTNFFTVGYGQSSSSVFDFISIAVPGSGNYSLSGVELNRVSYRFTGVLTGDRTIIVPSSIQQYWVDNSTSGAFSLFIQTAGQITPVEVLQGDQNILYCDGTDVIPAESSTVSFPIPVNQGGTGANTAAAARTNLGAVGTSRVLTAGEGLSGGGDLSSDRTFNLDLNDLTAESDIDPVADLLGFYDADNAVTRNAALAALVGRIVSGVRVLGSTGSVQSASPGAGSWSATKTGTGTYEITHNVGTDTGGSYIAFATCQSSSSSEGITAYVFVRGSDDTTIVCLNAAGVLADPDNLYFGLIRIQ